jgi:bifunctional non-homologous end joining protein LigD
MPHLSDLKPMLLDERPFDLHAPGWAYEIKFDGYRLMAEFGQGKCLLKTRSGANATTWFPEITRPLSNIKVFPEGPYIVDGEVCVIDDQGRSDFDRLHARARRRSWYGGCDPVTFCVFDLLTANGADQTQCPYLERKERLQRLFKPAPPGITFVGQFESDGELLFQGAVLPLELEGLIAKKVDSTYAPGVRSSDWVKVKRKGAVLAQRLEPQPSVP